MEKTNSILKRLDWTTVFIWGIMMIMGWFNIYAAVYNEEHSSIFDFTQRYGKQMIFIIAAVVLAIFVLVTDNKLYFFFSWLFYGILVFLLLLVLIIGKEINGAKSWFEFGMLGLQPSEFAKFATALALASYLNSRMQQATGLRTMVAASAIILAPAMLIALQPDMGSVITFLAFFIVLFREGMSLYVFISAILAIVLFILTLILGNIPVALALIVLAFIALWLFSGRSLALRSLGILLGTGAVSYITGRYLFGINNILIIVMAIILAGVVSSWYIFRYKLKMPAVIFVFLLGSILYLFTVDYAFHNILKPHQQSRINLFIGMEDDPYGKEYNLNQSIISIGSGGLLGKG